MKLFLIGLTFVGLFAYAVVNNQQVIHLQSVGSTHFCMYMGPANDAVDNKLKLGLLGCFKGDPYDVNEVAPRITEMMHATHPTIEYDFTKSNPTQPILAGQ